ncbi:MAG: hypothetical protein ABI643_00295 [Candidatus Doudnabacteria bacterium]
MNRFAIPGEALRSKLNAVFRRSSDPIKSFLAEPMNYYSLGIAGLLNIIHWLILLSKIKTSDAPILLHYSVVYGTDLVQKALYIYWIPLLALILLMINMAAASVFYRKEKLAAYFLVISSIAIQLIFLVASIVLINANAR